MRRRLPERGQHAQSDRFDVSQLLDAPQGSRRGALGAALRRLQRRAPDGPIDVPRRVTTYRTIDYDADLCLGCGACARACPAGRSRPRPAVAPAEVGRGGVEAVAGPSGGPAAGRGRTAS